VAEFDIMYNEGISLAGDVLDFATEMDIIEKRGSFYSYNGESLAQGRENCKGYLKEHPALMREIENLVREANGLATLPPVEVEEAVAEEAVPEEESPPAGKKEAEETEPETE
jgi:recombination protein RecA